MEKVKIVTIKLMTEVTIFTFSTVSIFIKNTCLFSFLLFFLPFPLLRYLNKNKYFNQNANNSHYYYVYISFFNTSESEDDEDDEEEEEEGRRAVASLTLSSKIFCFCAISSFKSLISLFFF